MTNDPFQLLIAAIASVRAEAEANPAFTYATGYLPYAYGAPLAYAHAPLVYTAAAGWHINFTGFSINGHIHMSP